MGSTAAKPFLQQLTDQTGETTHLAVLDDGEVLYVDKVESARSLRMPSQVGRRLPAHCTGVGKALLAHMPGVDVSSIMRRRGMPAFTARTITDLKSSSPTSPRFAGAAIRSMTGRSKTAGAASALPCATTAVAS